MCISIWRLLHWRVDTRQAWQSGVHVCLESAAI